MSTESLKDRLMAKETYKELKDLAKDEEANERMAKRPAKSKDKYSSTRVRQYFKANGVKIIAVDNGYNPADEEEVAILEHFVSIGFAIKN